MQYPTTGSIPYGKADLLLGVDILEAARATDPREQFRVAHKDRTCSVLNLHKQPTVYTLLGKDDFNPDELRDEIYAHSRVEHSYAKNLSQICEERLGSKQFVNIMMLGVAYQLGLIPVSAHSIAWAIKDTIRRDHRKNLKAFNIGRKLALEPRALPNRPEAVTWEQLVTSKTRILRKSRWFGKAAAGRFEPIARVVEDDGWGSSEDLPAFVTQVIAEKAKTVITRNDSPDISFDRSINPYRGCEHGCVYCFARPTHAYMGLSPGLDFES